MFFEINLFSVTPPLQKTVLSNNKTTRRIFTLSSSLSPFLFMQSSTQVSESILFILKLLCKCWSTLCQANGSLLFYYFKLLYAVLFCSKHLIYTQLNIPRTENKLFNFSQTFIDFSWLVVNILSLNQTHFDILKIIYLLGGFRPKINGSSTVVPYNWCFVVLCNQTPKISKLFYLCQIVARKPMLRWFAFWIYDYWKDDNYFILWIISTYFQM